MMNARTAVVVEDDHDVVDVHLANPVSYTHLTLPTN